MGFVQVRINQHKEKTMDRLKGKTAIVIGATSGMGRAMAKLFAAEGAQVVFSGRREKNGKEIEKEINDKGGCAVFVKADSTVSEQLKSIFDTAMEKFGKIDILVNNAGISVTTPVEDTPLEDFDRIMNLNIRSYYEACQIVVPIMKKQGFGNIINTASIGGLKGIANTTAYCTSKGAVRLFTKSLAAELAPLGIRVNSICPGGIMTEMLANVSEEWFEANKNTVPMRRIGSDMDIAYGAVYLASDEAGYVTGLDLTIDGGVATI